MASSTLYFILGTLLSRASPWRRPRGLAKSPGHLPRCFFLSDFSSARLSCPYHTQVTFYSQGMRQELFLRYGGEAGRREGFYIRNRSLSASALSDVTQRARFCFSPSGHGWGMRTGKNAMIGCVPLVAQPYVVQPFELQLPFEAFSLRADFEDLPRLPLLLRNVSDARLALMREALLRARRAFLWRVEAGGLAYNFTLLALCQRAVELRGGLKAGGSCRELARGLPEAAAAQRIPQWFPASLRKATLMAQAARRARLLNRTSSLRQGRQDSLSSG